MAAGVVALAVVLAGCSGGSGADEEAAATPSGSSSPAADDDREPAEVLLAAVDATLDADRLTISSQATLQVGEESFAVFTDGPVAWDEGVADLRFGVEQQGARTEVTVRGDGTDAWVRVEGPDAPAFPDGASWVQADAGALTDAASFTPAEFLAVVVALRAVDPGDAEGVQEFEAESHDGVDTRVLATTVSYVDAVQAAGEDADAFRTALSLTGPAEQSDLDIEVAVGPDDVIRTFDLTIDSEADVGGGYDIDLTDVGREVGAPGAPDADDVATGPEAERIFGQLLDS